MLMMRSPRFDWLGPLFGGFTTGLLLIAMIITGEMPYVGRELTQNESRIVSMIDSIDIDSWPRWPFWIAWIASGLVVIAPAKCRMHMLPGQQWRAARRRDA